MMMPTKNQQFNFVMTSDDRAMLDAIAKASYRSASNMIRALIRTEWERRRADGDVPALGQEGGQTT